MTRALHWLVRGTSEPRYVASLLLLMSLAAMLALPVSPWPRDDWFESRDLLFAVSPGADNYVPVTVPAALFKCAQWLSQAAGGGLRGEFYIASIAQNLLLFLSAVLVYGSLRALRLRAVAGTTALVYLAALQCVGVAQAMWSETTVVFLFAAALYVNVRLLEDLDAPARGRHFWRWTLCSAVLVALLVVTRVTPMFLIPAVAVLLWGRVGVRRVAAHVAIVCGATLIVALLTMWSNELRFGRFELTNSSGRHLWQGVTYMDEAALDSSATLRTLGALNPPLRGRNWWQITLPDSLTFTTGGDELLGAAAKDAIRNDLKGYLAVGLEKFARDVFTPVYQLGFEPQQGHPNPLETDALLPALGSLDGPFAAWSTRVLAAANQLLFEASEVLHPVVVFLVLTTLLWRALDHVRRRLAGCVVLLVAGGALLILMTWGRTPLPLPAVFAVCTAILFAQVWAHWRGPSRVFDDRLFVVLAALYFGSLWFSWQVEMPNSRNVVPYVPVLAVLAAMAATHAANRVTSAW